MKTETIADALELAYFITNAEDSWYTKAKKIKTACRVAKAWENLQVKRCNEPFTDADQKREKSLEKQLRLICKPYEVKFENLNARLMWDNDREFYFPDLNS